MASVGFKETKEVLDFVIPIVKGFTQINEDGKVEITELVVFLPALLKLKEAIEGVDQVPVEFKLATPEEAEDIKQYLRDTLDLADDKMEEFIEDSFALVLDLFKLIQKFTASNAEPTEADEA